jgi:tetratricopeptide (TPR) repeat protein
MKITPLTAVILVILFLLIVLPFINASNQSGGQPVWFKAYESAREAALAENDAERERQVNLVYEESSRYGGAMPPAEKMDFNRSLMENLLWFVPMQDRGVTTTYTQALRSLASSFENENRWDDAERFLRKAYELELAEKRIHPKSRIRPDTSELVNLLFKRGKRAEALKLQWEGIAELEAVAAEHGNSGYYLEPVLYQKAKVFEMEGKVDDAETCMKRIVEYYNYEINDKSLAELKKYNAKSEPAREGTCSLNMISRLENLADFYKRHDNHTGKSRP